MEHQMAITRTSLRRTHFGTCGRFWVWAAIGFAGEVAIGSFGSPMLLGCVAVVSVLFATRPSMRRSGFGLLTGAGLPLLYLAYLHRQGPGTTCWHTTTAGGCAQHLNPLPFLILGVVLVVGGVVGQAVCNRGEVTPEERRQRVP
jgi:hypothetical protein